MRHIHVSFLTPFIVLFSLWIVVPLMRIGAMMWGNKPVGKALAFVGPGY